MTTNTNPATSSEPKPLRQVVAENIRAEAARAGLNITTLGERTGRGRHWVDRRWHARHDFTLDDVDALAQAIGTTTDALTRRP